MDSSEWREWIDKVLDVLQRKSDLESSMVDKDVLNKVIQVMFILIYKMVFLRNSKLYGFYKSLLVGSNIN